jgi:prevent-host-death family protein
MGMIHGNLSLVETVSISQFKARCLELLKKVKRTGKPILVTKRGEPIAEVVPPSPATRKRKWLGSARGTGEILGDIVSPVSAEDWEALQGPE